MGLCDDDLIFCSQCGGTGQSFDFDQNEFEPSHRTCPTCWGRGRVSKFDREQRFKKNSETMKIVAQDLAAFEKKLKNKNGV